MQDILRYPIGKFLPKDEYANTEILQLIERIELLPAKLEKEVDTLSVKQLDTPYREGGWTVRQVIHHLADSHMNAYIRFKWTLTEETPMIKAYNEKAWAETAETNADPNLSLSLLKTLHAKWVVLLKGLSTNDLKKEFIHPETKKHIRLENLLGTYAWHGEHHLAHITSIKKQVGRIS
ncbi:MAG: bacillithiol transferase BstA [Bacteroidia bacterium]|nr:bacillithiol transferase BstA [Bacteroidia bacterium]